MFGAVAAHKFVIAFCIGVELIVNKTRTSLCIIYVCMFAVVSPLGIGIGMALVGGDSAAASGPAAVILQVQINSKSVSLNTFSHHHTEIIKTIFIQSNF